MGGSRRASRCPGCGSLLLAAGIALLCCLALLNPSSLRAWGAGLQAGERTLWVEGQALPSLFGAGGAGDARADGGNRAGQHEYWQVGLAAGPETNDATGIRTTIMTHVPQHVAPNTTNYFWIGSYLSDSSFIQIGYYVAWYDQSEAGWFYCAFTPNQQKGPCAYGSPGSVGGDGTTHTYTLAVLSASSLDQADATVWGASVDDAQVGQFAWTSAGTGPNTPAIFAESSGFTAHPATSDLGPVDFPVPIQARPAGQSAYISAEHLRPVYDAPDVCPPYGAGADATGGALLGSGLPCPIDAAWLW